MAHGPNVGDPTTLHHLLEQREFALTLLTSVHASAEPIAWAHSSDLDDPTPFVIPGQMLLTTGRQFVEGSSVDVDDYVAGLRAAGVVALGFGTEVIRNGTPADLVSACEHHGLPLVEVPYRTPFIALSRFIAEREASLLSERVEWALAAQNAVSIAALTGGRIARAVDTASEWLGCDIWVIGPDGETLERATAPTAATVGHREAALALALRLLGAGRRAQLTDSIHGAHTIAVTLGGSKRLRGALAAIRESEFDDAARSVLTTLTALIEVSLENSQDARIAARALSSQLLTLLEDGRIDAVRAAVESMPVGLPRARLRVVAVDLADSGDLRDRIERVAALAASGVFPVARDQHLLVFVDLRAWPKMRPLLDASGQAYGVSDAVAWPSLRLGITQAARALAVAAPGSGVQFSELVGSSFLGLLSTSSAVDVARARLDDVLGSAPELLTQAAVWLRHNAQWDPAARELDMHRHSLKTRMRALGELIRLDLDGFAGRAELWAMLSALDFGSAVGVDHVSSQIGD